LKIFPQTGGARSAGRVKKCSNALAETEKCTDHVQNACESNRKSLVEERNLECWNNGAMEWKTISNIPGFQYSRVIIVAIFIDLLSLFLAHEYFGY
jgi:hypothetical protein